MTINLRLNSSKWTNSLPWFAPFSILSEITVWKKRKENSFKKCSPFFIAWSWFGFFFKFFKSPTHPTPFPRSPSFASLFPSFLPWCGHSFHKGLEKDVFGHVWNPKIKYGSKIGIFNPNQTERSYELDCGIENNFRIMWKVVCLSEKFEFEQFC